MSKTIKKCRVCGKSYEACRTERVAGIFRWQDVACSPECGNTYLARINESRGIGRSVNIELQKRKSKWNYEPQSIATNDIENTVSNVEDV